MLGKRQNALITLNSSHLALTGLASSASIGDKSVMKMLVSKGNGTQSSKRTSPSCRRMRNRGRIRAASEQGSALVEFALVMPIFLTVVFGMCSFGFLINEYLQLTEVCNIGAEQLALTRSQSDPCQVVYNDVVQVSPHLNAPAMIFTFTLNGTVYGPYTGAASSCTAAATAFASLNPTAATPVTLNIQYAPTNFNVFYLISPVPTSNYFLTAQITEILQ
jgi:Flp pilus assembly protein TadG